MLKIAWCNDCKESGGAEITNNLLIKESPYQIDFMTAGTFNTDYDYYILNNCRTFTKEQLNYIANKKKFIIFWHDVIGQCFSFDIKSVKKILKKASFNIFLSPLHHKQVEKVYNIKIFNYQYQLPFIDAKVFNDSKRKRFNRICWVGSIYPHKGIEQTLMWARENNKKIDFYGDGDPLLIYQIKESKYGEYRGNLKYDFVNEIYKQYKYFIHLPNEVEACGRGVMEAYFSGCEMIVNENVGFYSYSYNFKQKQKIIDIINDNFKDFWDQINWSFDGLEKAIKKGMLSSEKELINESSI